MSPRTIQNATNFQGGYPSDGYHLYEFDLAKQNKIVTNDDEAYIGFTKYTSKLLKDFVYESNRGNDIFSCRRKRKR